MSATFKEICDSVSTHSNHHATGIRGGVIAESVSRKRTITYKILERESLEQWKLIFDTGGNGGIVTGNLDEEDVRTSDLLDRLAISKER